MTSEQSPERLSREEVRAFAQKVEAFGEQLNPNERVFLAEILARAAEGPDIQGFAAVDYFLKMEGAAGQTAFGAAGYKAASLNFLKIDALTANFLKFIAPPRQ